MTEDELRDERLRLVLIRHREQRDTYAALTIGCSCGWCPVSLQQGGSLLQQYLGHLVEKINELAPLAAASSVLRDVVMDYAAKCCDHLEHCDCSMARAARLIGPL